MTEKSELAAEPRAAEMPEGETRAGQADVIYLPDQSRPARQRKPGRRAPVPDPRSARFNVRCKPAFFAQHAAAARAAGMSLSAYVCVRLGEDRPEWRIRPAPPVADRALLAKALADIGKLGSNHNQLAHAFNATGETPDRASWERQERAIQEMRAALMRALGHAG